MTNRVTDTDKGAKGLTARLRTKGLRVRVGVLDDAPKTVEEGSAGGDLSLLDVAAIHEFGGGNVPQRSFIRATVDEKGAEITRLQKALALQMLRGEVTEEVALERLGAKVVAMCQNRIAEGIAPPNAPRTVAEKGSSTPLVDTGQLRSSVTHRVVRDG